MVEHMKTHAISAASASLALGALCALPALVEAGTPVAAARVAAPPSIAQAAPGNAGTLSTFAGGTIGFKDGAGSQARFTNPSSVAVDATGNIFVVDFGNQRIRKITPAGAVTTVAGGSIGFEDGSGAAARFTGPSGVAVDSSGNIVVVDLGNERIRKIVPDGAVSTLAGSGVKGFQDGSSAAAEFAFGRGAVNSVLRSSLHPIRLDLKYLFYPAGVAIDPHGNVIVADFSNHRIRKITPAGVVSTLAGSGINGFRDGRGADAQFTDPSGLAVDAAGNVYVADEGNNRIRKIAPDGVVTTLAGTGARGFRDGAAAQAQFAAPMGIAVDPSGDILVADSGNHRIREITPAGIVTSLTASTSGARGPGGADALFQLPTGVAVDARGDVYVADAAANQIQRITLR